MRIRLFPEIEINRNNILKYQATFRKFLGFRRFQGGRINTYYTNVWGRDVIFCVTLPQIFGIIETYYIMSLFDQLTARAKENPQRIVLPEGTEPRTLTAANKLIANGIADIILIGDPVDIKNMAGELNLAHISKATIVNPADSAVIDRYAPVLYELRKSKGMI